MNGLLLLDKPPGPTSHDVVGKVRLWANTPRVGHLGTLDPGAEGLLVLCLGEALKAVPWMEGFDKEYRARLRLGVVTETQDLAGRVLEERDPSGVSEASVRAACAGFVGPLEQRPPMWSALKVGGKKLVDLARQGREVERPTRRVVVHALTIERVALPEVEFTARVSKGTYVRTLCHDLGARLGSGGSLAWLRRTRVGPFDVADAVRADALPAPEALGRAWRPVREGLAHLAAWTAGPEGVHRVRTGQRARRCDGVGPAPVLAVDTPVLIVDESGDLVAIGAATDEGARPLRGFAEGVR